MQNLRLHKVNGQRIAIHDLSVVMSLDFEKIMADIHPSFVDGATGQLSISNETLARLTSELNSLKQEKQQRLLKVISKLNELYFPYPVFHRKLCE